MKTQATSPRRLFNNTIVLAKVAATIKQQPIHEFIDDLVRQHFQNELPDQKHLLEQFSPQGKTPKQ